MKNSVETGHKDFESLSLGSEGSIVLMIQKSLNHLGHHIKEDAIFNQEMHEVIVKFQEEHNLVSNGIIDYETMIVLDKDFVSST